ncbi:beta-L-arabinofuranosidase domain-containing protein [Arthrobacter nitrophenolicus]|uniref:beta-L-arabinofuranosidase domain-containing protein n=1 Tax=Arthrobacter nitrophenolicus TaxID=683150 RepID=UPI00389A3EA9
MANARGASFPLDRIRLLDSPFRQAQDTSVRYILSLDADRLFAPYLHEAGLEPAAVAYGNWESDGLGGHIGGHYLSGCAKLYAATGNPELLAKGRAAVVILGTCQAAHGDGYVGGVPRGRELGQELARGEVDADLFTLNGRWVPLYNLHKTLAGLLDAHKFAGSGEALDIAVGLAGWWLRVSARLADDAFEEVLHAEFGGMNEAFALLWELTGREEYLREARRLSHRALLDPLAAGQDLLDGLHANTQIPKVVGYARLAGPTHDADLAHACDIFWESVVSRRSVSIGGNSVREYFHPTSDFSPMVQDPQGPETCNTYNMLKLAKLRFEAHGDAAAVDFYERATYNHILSSQHPGTGGLVYFTPMRPGHYRVYSRAQESMWCCVGSGLENHARYGELIYSRAGNDLLVNLYIPSTLDWQEYGLRVRLETGFPFSDHVALVVTAEAPVEATIRLRRPFWAAEMEVDAGTGPGAEADDGGGYVSISRTWQGTSTVNIRLQADFAAEALPDGSSWVSFRYGPVVLAARAGHEGVEGFEAPDERMGHVASGPMLPLSQTPVVPDCGAIRLVDREALRAEMDVVDASGRAGTVLLEPFAGIHDERYTVYWPTGDPGQRSAELRLLDQAAAARMAVVDEVMAGEQQPESDHGFAGKATRAGGGDGLHWRSATGWFSYVLSDPGQEAESLRVRFRADEGRGHQLRLNGAVLDRPALERRDGDIVVLDYQVPAAYPGHEADGRLVFSVHALPGHTSGDLLSVALLRRGA